MKPFVKIIALSSVVFILAACSDDKAMEKATTADTKKETALEHAAKHMDPTYICPMHPEASQSDKPGTCPICGMDLVKVEADNEQASAPKEKKILYWVAPMDPTYRRDKPGKSPMGMDLVPVYDEGGDGAVVKISPAVENNMGVRTTKVIRNNLPKMIETVGYLDFDESKISMVHLRTKGWIEKLYIRSEGERVKNGQLLFELYSPELVTAQEEYLQALRSVNKYLIYASKERLKVLGMGEKQLTKLAKTRKVEQRVKIYATQDGIVNQFNIREGMFVTPSKLIFSLADLSSIWLLAEVFERQADWVKVGQKAEVTLSYLPDRRWVGEVEYIYPSLDPKTRTLKARLRFNNPDESLKPGMFAHVRVYGDASKDALIVPSEAVIRIGDKARVIVAEGNGRYRPYNVKLGIETANLIEIKSGLSEGDRVVTSAQFLIDSEASLKASLKRMTSPKDTAAKKPEMKMDKMESSKSTEPMKAVDGNSIDGDSIDGNIMAGKIMGQGVVTAINMADKKITLSHQPIKAIGWGEMTMPFGLMDEVDITSVKVGDNVTFELLKQGDVYLIKSIQAN